MSSVWLHAICAECWNRREPGKPVTAQAGSQVCCFCGERRAAGIYVRENPAHLHCKGQHAVPEGCIHEPADPAAAVTLCWHCGAIIRFNGEHWKTRERLGESARVYFERAM